MTTLFSYFTSLLAGIVIFGGICFLLSGIFHIVNIPEFSFIGLLLIAIGIAVLLTTRRRQRQIQWLRKNGCPVETTYQRFETNPNVTIKTKGPGPWRVVTRGTDPETGTARDFFSDDIIVDPNTFCQEGMRVIVFCHPKNPDTYFMDLDEIILSSLRNQN